ncbi:MAG: biotin carboxylase N-terminal domain-containing protein [Alcanivoracaceae bacterium]|nr:biotin carboxylase N-terminal domain-containing protein [Alcanivoracaceae bacterium]
MIKRLLIANRGEIARRIIATARQLGIETVAIYSDADSQAAHVRDADLGIAIGPAPARDSYLCADRIVREATALGVDAIHPGYGFLSENEAFARAVTDAGMQFVGPRPDAIRLMGDKAAARQLMAEHGVPVLPGFDRNGASDDALREAATTIGFPLLIKAVAGGGGKGMRIVETAADFDEALKAARREAMAAFADDRVLLERYLASARHVEVQVFADSHGNAVHLFERDCSVQRRHQKIIEEAPAPGLSSEQRAAMGQAAVRAARAIDYLGAGTVEFLLAPDGEFYFMEMNTRLQVEHPVTELITGQDLVAWQLAVAGGAPLPLAQDDITLDGHAMEVRVYAEDPADNFLPSTGTLSLAQWPRHLARVDTGAEQGDAISRHYDPMVAKIIVHGASRHQALAKLVAALTATRLHGIKHNIGFLIRVLQCPDFVDARLDTRLLEHWPELMSDSDASNPCILLAAVLASTGRATGLSPWDQLPGWRGNASARIQLGVSLAGHTHEVVITSRDGHWMARIDDQQQPLRFHWQQQGLSLQWGTHALHCDPHPQANRVIVFANGLGRTVELSPSQASADTVTSAEHAFQAPMSGTVVTWHTAPGAHVDSGDAVITLEAMKMEHTLRAPAPGTVTAFLAAEGDQVSDGQLLVAFEGDQDD